MKIKLRPKPCPFCVRELIYGFLAMPSVNIEYCVQCPHCRSRGPTRTYKANAVKAWNKAKR
jgi:hypothetical protein